MPDFEVGLAVMRGFGGSLGSDLFANARGSLKGEPGLEVLGEEFFALLIFKELELESFRRSHCY
jgi:hypothetical protein